MNWDAIGSIGEVIGALGVIVSLIYLATQIRQNSAWLKSSIIESSGTRTGDLTSTIYSDADLSRIVSIGFTPDGLTLKPEEKTRFSFVMVRAMRGHEINFAHYKSGLLDEESFNGFIQNMTVWTNSPLFDEWWETTSPIFRKDFCEKVKEVRKIETGIRYELYKE